MYKPGTELAKREKQDNIYDEVVVIGQSPITYGSTPDFSGPSGQCVVVKPKNDFGATIEEEYEKLRDLYEITSEPSGEIEVEPPKIISRDYDPTPEDVLRGQSKGKKSKRRRSKRKNIEDEQKESTGAEETEETQEESEAGASNDED